MEPLPTNGSLGDEVHLVARMGLSAIPLLGGPALELFNQLLSPPLEQRREEWLNKLNERLIKLEKESVLSIVNLGTKEEFVSIMMQTTAIALRTHQQEKLEALRNAVINTAIGLPAEDGYRELFVSLIDGLTPWHLSILKEIQSKVSTIPKNKDVGDFVQTIVPVFKGQTTFAKFIAEDLVRKGLLIWSADDGLTETGGPNTSSMSITELGTKFRNFIS